MTTVAAGALNQIPFGVPDPPREFGQDGGRFYRLYDNLAEEIDDDLTKGLKEQLDGLLIFAGLFAGVNSAFLALTLPLLSADPADDTNALLAQNNAILMQLMQGRNDTGLGSSALPSTSFSPSHGIFTVNVLFSFSLSLAIISSFLAVLGRQWLVYYRKRSGGGPDRQRWEQLRRFLGAERWRLELVLDDILPSLLQIGLIIFCVSLILYLHVLNPSISRIVGIPMCLGLAIFVLGALFTVWDRFCPFQSPLSHLFCWVTNHVLLWSARIWRIVWPKLLPLVPFILLALGLLAFYVGVLLLPVWLPFLGFAYLVGLPGSSISRDLVSAFSSCLGDLAGRRDNSPSQSQHNISGLLKRFFRSLFRGYFTVSTLRGPKNEVTFLQVVALKRAICTSDDPLTLLCATANIFTIDETRYLEGLWSDEMFHSRFLELCTNPYQRIVQLLGRDRIEAATSAARLYRGALCHIFLSLDPPNGYLVFEDPKVPEDIFQAIMSEPLVDPSWLIPPEMVYGCSPALIEAALASWMLRACVEYVPVERIGNHITEYSDSLSASDWKLVSLIIYILTRFPHSSDRVEIIQDGPRPFYSSPKRYDTVGSVMTAGLPLFTQPFAGQPVIVRQPAPQHEQQFIQTTGVPIYPVQSTGHVVGSPLYGVGTGHPIAAQPTGILPTPSIQGQITGGPPQPIVFEGSVGDRFYVQGTGQTVPLAYTTGPNRPIYTGPHTGEGPFMTERVPTGQQGFNRSVGMTLTALEEVAIDLARQQYAADLDSHRILLNILRCAREIIIDESRYPNTRVRDKLGLLDIAEQVLRIEDIPVQVRATATMLRMDCVAMLRLRFMTGDARRK
ncbi:hypothetical protein FRC05_009858 [Tulasnella sp. 425]|nr:hypothetical protein FRC05_009858 [Tulasnella sp. 425]